MINNNIVPGFLDEKDDSLIINLEAMENISGCIIVNLSGYVDTYNTAYFTKQMNKILDAGFKKIVFNCATVNYVSSTGISAFTTLHDQMQGLGGEMILTQLQSKVKEVFQLLGFADYFHFEDQVEKGVAFFSGKPAADAVFPKVVACPLCGHKLKATKSGRFRCPGCKSVIAISEQGAVSMG